LRSAYLQTLIDVAALVGPPLGTPAVTSPSTRHCPAPPGHPPCGWLEGEIFRQHAQIREAALADPRTPHSNEAFEESIEFLKRFARERATIVRAYVADVPSDIGAVPDVPSSDSSRYRNLRILRSTRTPSRIPSR
jgi:hypothetical protein